MSSNMALNTDQFQLVAFQIVFMSKIEQEFSSKPCELTDKETNYGNVNEAEDESHWG